MVASGLFSIQEINSHGEKKDTSLPVEQVCEASFNSSFDGFVGYQGELHHRIDILIAGSGQFRLGQREVSIKAGEMLWSLKGSHPSLVDLDHSSLLIRIDLPIVLAMELKLCRSFELDLFCGKVFSLAVCNDLERQQLLRQTEELKAKDEVMKEIALEELKLLLRRLSQYASRRPHLADMEPVRERGCYQVYKMVLFISDNFREELSVEKIAGHVGLHKNFAMNLFKKIMGQSLLEFTTSLRIRYAEKLLLNTQENITSIAYASGFSSLTRFYEVFGRHFGDSPQRYRKRCWYQDL
ncbi:hypothetical protein BTA51_11160 [Hahella sp. CCB-MM4]|uniref:helix-turn-helix domain-containing protein n=1 Tax=Hahella sp. (strain CCB-MM4) TaxID=1926491 RepID=UPI000B9C3059|nr:helix-turn-helix domain-containing protein [Hahella sp. CCB-MM4]OZG73554.1 hypothetical protein BTA51_11160 [Hahella sp. CCB-MM4]